MRNVLSVLAGRLQFRRPVPGAERGLPPDPSPRAWADTVVAELDQFGVSVTGCLILGGYERTCPHGTTTVLVEPGGTLVAGSVIIRSGHVIRAFPSGGFQIGHCAECDEAGARAA